MVGFKSTGVNVNNVTNVGNVTHVGNVSSGNNVTYVVNVSNVDKIANVAVFILAGQAGDDTNGWKAKGWNLDKPDWTGKLKLLSRCTRMLY